MLAYPAPHFAVADGAADHAFVYLNVRIAAGRERALVAATGDALLAAVRAHFAPIFASRPVGITLQIDESRGRSSTPSTATCIRSFTGPLSMLDDRTIAALAAELHDAQQRRVQVRHFSKRHPGMTIEDGYAIQRAWVQTRARRRARRQGPQDRPHLARDAAGVPDRRARLRAAARRHVLRAGGDIPFDRFIAPRVEVELAFVLGAAAARARA